jgi:hypothetical protein
MNTLPPGSKHSPPPPPHTLPGLLLCLHPPPLQVAISTRDVYKTAEQIRAAGGKITREPGGCSGGTQV